MNPSRAKEALREVNQMPSWLPSTQAQRLIWLQNFALKFALYVGTAGITAGDVTQVNGWLASYQWILNRSEQIATVLQDLNAWKDIYANGPEGTALGAFPTAPTYPAVPPLFTPTAGMWPQLLRLIERTRNSAGFTEAMAEDLGVAVISGSPTLGDPTFEAIAQPNNEVRINWVKGASSGVIGESQRGTETTWTVLGTDTSSPYLDSRDALVAGQPEVRRYRIRYLVGDEAVGNYSAIVSVTTIP